MIFARERSALSLLPKLEGVQRERGASTGLRRRRPKDGSSRSSE